MDMLRKLSPTAQAVLGGSILYLIFSFFDWQQYCFGSLCGGRSEWSGIGIIASLLVLALIAWEAVRLLQVKIELGSLAPGLVSVGLALLLLVFTIITFLTHSTARHWPAWIGLLLSVVIAAAAFSRAREEGVQMPQLPQTGGGSSGGGAPSQPASAPPSPPPTEQGPPPAETPPGNPPY